MGKRRRKSLRQREKICGKHFTAKAQTQERSLRQIIGRSFGVKRNCRNVGNELRKLMISNLICFGVTF